MLTIIGISFRDGYEEIVPWQDKISMFCRLCPGIILGTASFIALISTMNEEDTRGANFNASGVACLLALAEYFAEQPEKDVELHFVFTGAHQCWMAGLRHFLRKNILPKRRTLFINVEGVGSGDLHIITEENMLFTFKVDSEILQFLDKHHLSQEINKADSLPVPTSSFMIILHGYKGFTLMGLDKDKKPMNCNQIEDTIMNIDESKIKRTMEIILRFVQLWIEEKK